MIKVKILFWRSVPMDVSIGDFEQFAKNWKDKIYVMKEFTKVLDNLSSLSVEEKARISDRDIRIATKKVEQAKKRRDSERYLGEYDMKILWLTNIPSPYRVDFFNELGKHCDLTVLFEKRSSDERDDSWKKFKTDFFNAIYLKGKSVGVAEAFCPEVVKYLNHTYDHIIVTNFSDPTGVLAIATLKVKRIPYIIESDGGFAGSGRGIKEMIKKWLFSGARLYFSTAKEHDKYYLTYGAKKEKIVRYPFTSLRNKDILPVEPTISEKRQLRKKLNINEAKVIVSVGRFSYLDGYGKGYDILLKVAEKVGCNYGFYIIGDEPTDEFLDWKKNKNLNNVHFIGYKQKDDLSLYYRAADVFMLLSRGEAWGLVVNEAMAHGLPIIASDKTISASELVHNGKNGYVVSVNDQDMIAAYLMEICMDDSLRLSMAKESIKIINQYTIENMSIEHIKIFSGGVPSRGKNLL